MTPIHVNKAESYLRYKQRMPQVQERCTWSGCDGYSGPVIREGHSDKSRALREILLTYLELEENQPSLQNCERRL